MGLRSPEPGTSPSFCVLSSTWRGLCADRAAGGAFCSCPHRSCAANPPSQVPQSGRPPARSVESLGQGAAVPARIVPSRRMRLRCGARRSRCRCKPSRCLYAVHWLPTISAVHGGSRHTSQRFALPCPAPLTDTVHMRSHAPTCLVTAGLDVGRFLFVLVHCCGVGGALTCRRFPWSRITTETVRNRTRAGCAHRRAGEVPKTCKPMEHPRRSLI